MKITKRFENPEFGGRTLTIDDATITMDCYTRGSLLGGAGTECSHTIDLTKRMGFFDALGVADSEALFALVDSYAENEWSELHDVVVEHQTDSQVWFETDWSDSIDIEIAVTGEAKVGSTLAADASALSSEGTFSVSYTWYSGLDPELPFEPITGATNETYRIVPADRGCYIRCEVGASDNEGFNSSFKPGANIGPVV
jgi:hypothetical protein